ncbi:MAG TPA: hypothetical protein DCF33_13920 [Saprospirales bacterium]|nr:hypothetical protein [Saprospirales bacterium]
MKKPVALTFLFLTSFCAIRGQSIAASYLQIYSKTTAVVPVVNGGNGDQGTDNSFSFSYEHFLKNREYSIVASYSKFNGCTLIYFEPGGWIAGGGDGLAKGFCQGVKIHRFDLELSYLLTKKTKKFYLKPFVGAGLQLSRKTGVDFWRDGLPINGPNYFELEPMRAEPRNTTQIVPSLGFRTGFVFWKRLDIGLGFQGVYAFKPYQKLFLKYQYKGVIQPMAEYETTGTGLFITLGVGYRFARLIK